jgi:hypothetical protein
LAILIGSSSSRLALGQVATSTVGALILEDGTNFGAKVFFEAKVNGYNPSTGRAHGTFAFVSNTGYGARQVVVAEGSFAMN